MKKQFFAALAATTLGATAAPDTSTTTTAPAECKYPVVALDFRTTAMARKQIDGQVVLSMTYIGSNGLTNDAASVTTYAGQYSSTDKTAPIIFMMAGVADRFGAAGSIRSVPKKDLKIYNEELERLQSLKDNVEKVAKCKLPAIIIQSP